MDKSQSFLIISLSQYYYLEAHIIVFMLKKLDVSVEINHESLNDQFRSVLITWFAAMQTAWNKRNFFFIRKEFNHHMIFVWYANIGAD